MASLSRDLRKDLEKTVKQARRVAEAGARKAVGQLGVGEAEAPKHLTAEQRALRNRLRAHGRQLGDRRDPKGVQATTRLVQECAYEQWHRMLFARFLAETDLLIEPESGMAITLNEVQELAREKATDWLPLASGYAERMLPQIFRKDDPVLEITLPPETRSEMEDLLKGLTKPVFEADDSLGWVYQFWQTDKKDEVNKSEVKIGADELPAVTQLFTEDYMVLFLLHNTLGAWWAGKVLAANPALARSATDEGELRVTCKVGNIDWTYLRFVRDEAEDGTEGLWRPAAGVFEGWPKAAKDITVLDPCMGSGHFLVFALPILVAFRMAEEGLSQSAAIEGALKDNLFGLEIDPRCTQIAAFNLAFAAWRKVGHRPLPQLNLACSGLAIGVTKAEWLKLAENVVTAADPAARRDLLGVETNLLTQGLEERIRSGLEALYDLFAKAPLLGSLIDPRRISRDLLREGFDKLEPLLALILAAADTDDVREAAVAAQGMAKASKILSDAFVIVATNVPYLGRGKVDDAILDHIDKFFPDASQDLSTVFVERLLGCLRPSGSLAVVFPQNCFYQPSCVNFRENLLRAVGFDLLATLGEEAWQSFGKRGPQATLAVFSSKTVSVGPHFGLDATKLTDIPSKERHLIEAPLIPLTQRAFEENDGHRIILESGSTFSRKSKKIGAYATASQGIKSGDDDKLVRYFFELESDDGWKFLQTTSSHNALVGGLKRVVRWKDGGEEIARRQGQKAWGLRGIAVSQMRYLPAVMYYGDAFDSNVCAIAVKSDDHLKALLTFAHSGALAKAAKKIEPDKKINNGTFEDIPFDIDYWLNQAGGLFPLGIPKPNTDDATQWIFSGNPASAAADVLHVASARLLGYRWPRQKGAKFADVPPIQPDGLEPHTDFDGIVCLPPLKTEPPAEQRLSSLLAKAFGPDWSAAKLARLISNSGGTEKSLDHWMRDDLFAQHCDLFSQRPFIWHIWDGREDGFHALINYHRLAAPNGEGRRTLEKLIYSYLGDWIDGQRTGQKAGVEGADARLAHAEHLKGELIKILHGEPPYDIFVRWKPLHEQAAGWDPDINDGVRMNIRPFMIARPLGAKARDACILRTTPRIKWEKDRGKEPTCDKAHYPWLWSWDKTSGDFAGGEAFDGNRWNDLHYSRAVKQAARDRFHAKAGGKK